MKQQATTKQGMTRLLEISGEGVGRLVVSMVLTTCGTLCQLVPFLAVYQVMKELLLHAAEGQALDAAAMMHWAWIGLAGLLAGCALAYAGGMMAHTFAYRVICAVRLAVAAHIGRLPLGYVTAGAVGKTKQVLDADVEQMEGFLAHQLPDLVSTLVMLVAMCGLMFRENGWLALACLLPIVVGFACQMVVMVRILKSGGVKENFDALEKISASATQYVQGMPSIKIFGQTVRSFRRFYQDIIDYRDFTTRMTEMIRPGYVLFRLFVLSTATFIVPVGLLFFLKAPEDTAFVVTFLFFLILGPGVATPTLKLRSFSESMNIIGEGVRRVDAVLSEAPLPEPVQSLRPQGTAVVFEGVSFAYGAKGPQVLTEISFTAKPGQITALVGPSGAGKSTIAALIPRFWDVSEGRITVGGVDIRAMRMEDLMAQLAFVFQEIVLFSDTVAGNIALGCPEASRAEIVAAAKAAQCHDFIMALPHGYDTRIGDGGGHLSGGEKQRLAVARAILKNAPILVLDEATAYADAENEHAMQCALEALMKDKTVIMIAHRLATIRHADQILVVDGGRIVERGTHEALLRQQGLYSAMWQASEASAAWTLETEMEV